MTPSEIEAEIKRLKGLLEFNIDAAYREWINNRIDELYLM